MTDFAYYYNNHPEWGLVRNNLIYTSLISTDKKTFCMWYHNDTEYHQGKNQVVDPKLMDMKWKREVKFLTMMDSSYPHLIPKILDIDFNEKKIYLAIDGVDLWQRSLDANCEFDDILPDWQEQMLKIVKAHNRLGIYKYSMHPSSYFIVDGKLKSINYFFCYTEADGDRTVREHLSHISFGRQEEMFPKLKKMGIDVDEPVHPRKLQMLCFESFRSNFPDNFIEQAKDIYVFNDTMVEGPQPHRVL